MQFILINTNILQKEMWILRRHLQSVYRAHRTLNGGHPARLNKTSSTQKDNRGAVLCIWIVSRCKVCKQKQQSKQTRAKTKETQMFLSSLSWTISSAVCFCKRRERTTVLVPLIPFNIYDVSVSPLLFSLVFFFSTPSFIVFIRHTQLA